MLWWWWYHDTEGFGIFGLVSPHGKGGAMGWSRKGARGCISISQGVFLVAETLIPIVWVATSQTRWAGIFSSCEHSPLRASFLGHLNLGPNPYGKKNLPQSLCDCFFFYLCDFFPTNSFPTFFTCHCCKHCICYRQLRFEFWEFWDFEFRRFLYNNNLSGAIPSRYTNASNLLFLWVFVLQPANWARCET